VEQYDADCERQLKALGRLVREATVVKADVQRDQEAGSAELRVGANKQLGVAW
jgi:hypothetical protein